MDKNNLIENYKKKLLEFTKICLFPFSFEHNALFELFQTDILNAKGNRLNTTLSINQKRDDIGLKRFAELKPNKGMRNLTVFTDLHESPSIFALINKNFNSKSRINILLSLMPAVKHKEKGFNSKGAIALTEEYLINQGKNHTLKRMEVSGGNFNTQELQSSIQILIVFCVSLFDSLLKGIFENSLEDKSYNYQNSKEIKKQFKQKFDEENFFESLQSKLKNEKVDISIPNNTLKGAFTDIFNFRHKIVHRSSDEKINIQVADLILLFYYAGELAFEIKTKHNTV